MDLDRQVESNYGDLGIKWIGREISLVGIFAALGKYSNKNHIHPTQSIELLKNKIIDNPKVLQLEEFESLRNRLDLSKINIGSVNKKAVYEGVYAILSDEAKSISWSLYFKGVVI